MLNIEGGPHMNQLEMIVKFVTALRTVQILEDTGDFDTRQEDALINSLHVNYRQMVKIWFEAGRTAMQIMSGLVAWLRKNPAMQTPKQDMTLTDH
jgi:hypothetical protein